MRRTGIARHRCFTTHHDRLGEGLQDLRCRFTFVSTRACGSPSVFEVTHIITSRFAYLGAACFSSAAQPQTRGPPASPARVLECAREISIVGRQAAGHMGHWAKILTRKRPCAVENGDTAPQPAATTAPELVDARADGRSSGRQAQRPPKSKIRRSWSSGSRTTMRVVRSAATLDAPIETTAGGRRRARATAGGRRRARASSSHGWWSASSASILQWGPS